MTGTILCGGECFRLDSPEINSKTENHSLCAEVYWGTFLGDTPERK